MKCSQLKLNKILLVLSLITSAGGYADAQFDLNLDRSGLSLYETSSARTVSTEFDCCAVAPATSFTSTSFARKNTVSVSAPVEAVFASSYSVKGTTSFVNIHTDVAGSVYQESESSKERTGRRRIIITPDDHPAGEVGQEMPVGDAVLPLLLLALAYVAFLLLRQRRLSVNNSINSRSVLRTKINNKMKKFFVFLTSVILFTSVSTTASAASASDIFSDGDTITIYSSSYYLAVEGNNIARSNSTANTNILWKLIKSGNQWNFQSIANPTRYLYGYKSGSNYNLSLSTNRSAFTIVNQTSSSKYDVDEGTMETGVYCSISDKTRYIYYQSRSWANMGNNSQDLTLQKWTAGKTDNLTISNVDATIVGYSGLPEWQNYSKTIDVSLTYTVTTDFHNMANPNTKITSMTATTTETNAANLPTPTFSWLSSGNGVSHLAIGDMGSTVNQDMFTFPTPTVVNRKWRIVVSAIGNSPMGLNNEGEWVDYRDQIQMNVTVNGKNYDQTMLFVRQSFHEQAWPNILFTIGHEDYTFPWQGESLAETLALAIQEGYDIKGTDNNVVVSVPMKAPEDITNSPYTTITANALQQSVGEASEWMSYSPDFKNNTAHVVASENPTYAKRYARLVVNVVYDDGTKYFEKLQTFYYAQNAKGSDGSVVFLRQGGVDGDGNLDANGFQKVHESRTTIYCTPGQEVKLLLKERNLYGYHRWYDAESQADPAKNPTPFTRTTWATQPKNSSGNNFSSIGTGAAGLFAFNTSKRVSNWATLSTSAAQVPVINMWNDGKKHTIACDVSNWRDYEYIENDERFDGKPSLMEPTLSYRQYFDLIPASVMADSIEARNGRGEYYEAHHYIVPTGIDGYLVPDFRFRANTQNSSDMCYFYRDGGNIVNVGTTGHTVSVYLNGAPYTPSYQGTNNTTDNMIVRSETAKTDTIDVRVGNVLLIRYIVEYMDRSVVGPSSSAGAYVFTDEAMEADYNLLVSEDFSLGAPAPGTTSQKYLLKHLPWQDAAFGYFYPTDYPAPNGRSAASSHNTCVGYGEYGLVNTINLSWAKGENHGGAANGYCMYVDGSQIPGMVASITSDQRICSGQQLYCSAWFCNPAPTNQSGDKPIFRFNVQGRNTGETEWHDVAVFTTGAIDKNSGWRQVCFPLISDVDYDETRVCVFNFALDNTGNDFLFDDFRIFSSKIALSTYQANTACVYADKVTTVIRLDYPSLTGDWANKFIYYDVVDEGTDPESPDDDEAFDTNYFRRDSSYYVDGEWNGKFGSILIPANDYNPTSMRDSHGVDEHTMIYPTIATFIDAVTEPGSTLLPKCYVQETVRGEEHWVMYFVHVLDHINPAHSYRVRMGNDPTDLSQTECALTVELPMVKKTTMTIDGVQVVSPKYDLCANELFKTTMVVSNVVDGVTKQGECMADWLKGYQFDSIYNDLDATPEQIEWANEQFFATYGYTRDQVKTALMDMRRKSMDGGVENPNRLVDNVNLLHKDAFNNEFNYTIITKLVDEGLLKLGLKEFQCYLASQTVVRFWIFPINETAVADDGTLLSICDEPQWLDICSYKSDYDLYFSTVDRNSLSEADRIKVPAVRVSKEQANTTGFTVPISNMQNVVIGWDSTQIHSTNDPIIQAKIDEFGAYQPNRFSMRFYQDKAYEELDGEVYYSVGSNVLFKAIDAAHVTSLEHKHTPAQPAGQPGWQHANTDVLRPGYEYIYKTTMLSKLLETNDPIHDGCPVGESFFNLIVVPDTMIWRPKGDSYNEWGDDSNWRAIINGVEQDYGYVPMSHVSVIIPEQPSELLYPYISGTPLSIDAHYTPVECKDIYFTKNAVMANQHLLKYERAFVDMDVPAGDWYAMAAPLQDMYAGDLYIPTTENVPLNSSVLSKDGYITNTLDHERGVANTYHFWASYYDRHVTYLKSASEGWFDRAFSSEDWNATNDVAQPLTPGTGFGVLAAGPNYTTSGVDIVVRLPKRDTDYGYTTVDGRPSSATHFTEIVRDSANRLAFLPDEGKDYQTITLTSGTSGGANHFLFGNPTMAYIDMQAFLTANGLSTTYSVLSGSDWKALTMPAADPIDRYLAPKCAALISLPNGEVATSKTVQLKVSQLTVSPSASAEANRKPMRTNLPKYRRILGIHTEGEELTDLLAETMHIYAFNNVCSSEITIGLNQYANNAYVEDEDALFLSSGAMSAYSDTRVVTPMNLYSVSGNDPLKVDVRNSISSIPLGLVMCQNSAYRSDSMNINFSFSIDWPETVWFYDVVKDTKVQLLNGMTLRVPMPQDFEQRYYIIGSAQEDDEHKTPTNLENGSNVSPERKALGTRKWISNGMLVILRDGVLYNAQGQVIDAKYLNY